MTPEHKVGLVEGAEPFALGWVIPVHPGVTLTDGMNPPPAAVREYTSITNVSTVRYGLDRPAPLGMRAQQGTMDVQTPRAEGQSG